MSKYKILSSLFCFLLVHLISAQLDEGLNELMKFTGPNLTRLVNGLPLVTTTARTTTIKTTASSPTKPLATTKPGKKPTEACGFTPTFVNGKRSCKDKLIFQDNFGQLLDTKWRIENRFAGEPDYEFTIYEGNEENVYVNKNKLYIRPTLTNDKYGDGFVTGDEELNLEDACTGRPGTEDCVQKPRAWRILPPTISGLMSTKGRFSFLYGIVEIKARFPKGDWIYPQLHLKPKSDHYGEDYKSGLNKIAQVNGNANMSKILSGGVILSQSDAGRTYGMKSVASPTHWNRDFHVYRIEWTAESITLKVDDEVYGVVEPPEDGFCSLTDLEHEPEVLAKWQRGSKLAPFDKEMNLVLGVGVGGPTFPDSEGSAKPWENQNPKGALQFYKARDVWTTLKYGRYNNIEYIYALNF